MVLEICECGNINERRERDTEEKKLRINEVKLKHIKDAEGFILDCHHSIKFRGPSPATRPDMSVKFWDKVLNLRS